MTQNGKGKKINETLIKFTAPETLKSDLVELANERNITLSSLLRLIATEWVKHIKHKDPPFI